MDGRAVLAGLLVLLVTTSGCAGLPTLTPSPSGQAAAGTASATGTAVSTPSSGLTVEVTARQDPDGDGAAAAFTFAITADTRLPDADASGHGEPFFVVAIEGTTVTTTERVDRSKSTTVTVRVGADDLRQFDPGSLSVTVTLLDEDVSEHDTIARWSGSIDYEPRATGSPQATPTPTPTATPTSTSTPTQSERTEFHVTVVEVVDGDTVEVRFPDGHTEDVRLLGVDTPEVHTTTDPAEWEGIPTSDAGRDHLRDWGHKASEWVRTQLERGEQVRIVVDDSADRRGAYGRLLVYLYDDGTLLNRQLIERGYARFYDSTFSKRQQFERAEANAREADVGVWDFDRTATPTPTPDGGQLAVVEIHADADGNDHTNENDEYVVFKNTGDATLDLSGWTVEDDAGHTYRFPDGFTLAPGETVTLHTGSGDDSDTHLYWGSDSAIWNNGGDTILVSDDDGTLVIERSYS